MKETTNYALRKIDLTDNPPDITVINPNFDIIDTKLKKNAAAIETHWAEKTSYVMTITRDISVDGVQSVTGLPFKPKWIEVKACINGSSIFSLGSYAYGDGIATQGCQYASDNNLRFADVGKAIRIALNGGVDQSTGYIQNLTNISLEIMWAKEDGNPVGTAIIILSMGGHY